MKFLNGKELADYIKERQTREVRGLRQAHGIVPKLAIILTTDDPTSAVYTRMKKRYGADIDAEVDIHRVTQDEALKLIKQLNKDDSVHAIIVQLPIERPEETEAVVGLVAPEKDVDGLGPKPAFEPATPLAVLWLLAGYNVDLRGKKVLLVGRGKLVGGPLERIFQASGVDVWVANSKTVDLKAECLKADVVITATGRPGLVKGDMFRPGTVVVDAGVAGEDGKTVGDLDPDVYQRDDLIITPAKGGVGPLTVCALFDNTIQAAKRTIKTK